MNVVEMANSNLKLQKPAWIKRQPKMKHQPLAISTMFDRMAVLVYMVLKNSCRQGKVNHLNARNTPLKRKQQNRPDRPFSRFKVIYIEPTAIDYCNAFSRFFGRTALL